MERAVGEDPAVSRFREYLRFPSVHPDPDYTGCIEWLQRQAVEIGLEFHMCCASADPNEFAIWLTWTGLEPSLKSILLNSHMDVVPVIEPMKWRYEPFSAEKDEYGNIHARGAVDMKCVGAQYLEAIRRLRGSGFTPLRTVHVSFVPDEEVGGFRGMGMFIKTPQFANLKVGFALDEGLASHDEVYNIYYAERAVLQFRVTATGVTGDAARITEGTAAEKLNYVLTKLMALRDDQNNLWKSAPYVDLGDITSVNLTMLSGGVAPGIIPPELSAVFDIRVTPQWDMEDILKFLYDTCIQAGPGVSYSLGQHSAVTAQTPPTDSNIWWRTVKAAADAMHLVLNPRVFPVATDVRFIRETGIPAFGFSPMVNMPLSMDIHEEYIHEDTFLKGITIYETLIRNITNVPSTPDSL